MCPVCHTGNGPVLGFGAATVSNLTIIHRRDEDERWQMRKQDTTVGGGGSDSADVSGPVNNALMA